MSSISGILLASVGLIAGIIVMLELGYRVGVKSRSQTPDGLHQGLGGIEAAIFGLLGLLLAFTFSGASARFENRRQLIISETNAIGTACLRLDLLTDADRDALRQLLKEYADARIAFHRVVREGADHAAELQRVEAIQKQIWTRAGTAVRRPLDVPAAQLLIPALNEMFDLATARTASLEIHAPPVIILLLFALVLLSSTLAGYSMSARPRRAPLHITVFAGDDDYHLHHPGPGTAPLRNHPA